MKKTFKRAGVAVLSMAMLLSMGAVGAMTASAAAPSITVESTSTGLKATDTVTAYKVAKIDGGKWVACDGFESVLTNAKLTQLAGITTTDNEETKKVAYDLAALTSALASAKTTPLTVGSETTVDDEAYYLVLAVPSVTDTDDRVIQPMLVAVDGNQAKIETAKASTLTLTKKITEVDGHKNSTKEATDRFNIADNGKSADIEKDSTVTYNITSVIPRYNPNVSDDKLWDYTIKDTPATSLYLTDTQFANIEVYIDANANGVKDTGETVLSKTTDYSITGTEDSSKYSDFTVNLTPAQFRPHEGQTIGVCFKATLTGDAVVYGNAGNNNHVKLTYDNVFDAGSKPASPSPTDKPDGEKEDDAIVYTTKLVINKYKSSKADTNKLSGVTFGLYKGSKLVATKATNDEGVVTFDKLGVGQYTLKETHIDGYVDKEDITFEISDTSVNGSFASDKEVIAVQADKTFLAEIINTPTSSLPGTGGMGTVLFTVGGAAIVMLAGAMFVVYMRKRKNEE